jgi:serine protease SohB
VHGYGLAAAQLMRIRAQHIPLVVAIDKIAASGGYLMACVANKILSAPFAIIGSIGVVVQLPNFNRLLKEKNIDFELHTAGEFKRTITLFGENTDEGREKLQHEIEDIHGLFKGLIHKYRKQIDIEKVATGEHWLGQQALILKLVDEIKTSDEYLLEQTNNAQVFEICYEVKRPLLSRLSSTASSMREKLFHHSPYDAI